MSHSSPVRAVLRSRLVLCLMAAAVPGLALACLLLPAGAPARWIGIGIALGAGLGWALAERTLLGPVAMGSDALRWAANLARIQPGQVRAEALFRLLADEASNKIAHLDEDFRRTYVSRYCRELYGYEPEELIGQHPADIIRAEDRPAVVATLLRMRDGLQSARMSYRVCRKDGQEIWVETCARRLEPGRGYVVVTRDISERKALEERLEALNRQLAAEALQDTLTGLPNRRRFLEAFRTAHRQSCRIGAPLALIMLDLDCFKDFNDLYGHPAGDSCLRLVGEAMQQALGGYDALLARLGGEEFALLLPLADEAVALAMARRLTAAVRNLALPHDGMRDGLVTVSAGVAELFPSLHPGDPARVIDWADRALYAAKSAGRDTVRAWSECRQAGFAPPPQRKSAVAIPQESNNAA